MLPSTQQCFVIDHWPSPCLGRTYNGPHPQIYQMPRHQTLEVSPSAAMQPSDEIRDLAEMMEYTTISERPNVDDLTQNVENMQIDTPDGQPQPAEDVEVYRVTLFGALSRQWRTLATLRDFYISLPPWVRELPDFAITGPRAHFLSKDAGVYPKFEDVAIVKKVMAKARELDPQLHGHDRDWLSDLESRFLPSIDAQIKFLQKEEEFYSWLITVEGNRSAR